MASGKKARRGKVTQETTNPVEYGFRDVKPLNFIQGEYLRAIQENEIIFGVGSAGTGKTYVAATYAAGELFHRRVEKIILTRPNVETGRGRGFLPGTLEEKYAPYLDPFDQVFTRSLGKGFYEYAIKSKNIDPKPLGFMRGATFDNCIVLSAVMLIRQIFQIVGCQTQ
jgi:phosphate starvation-inducible PhoH-like protein